MLCQLHHLVEPVLHSLVHFHQDTARDVADCCSLAVFGCMMRRHGRPRCHDKSAKTADRVVTTEMRRPSSPDNSIVPTLLEDPSWKFGEAPTPKYDAWPPGPIRASSPPSTLSPASTRSEQSFHRQLNEELNRRLEILAIVQANEARYEKALVRCVFCLWYWSVGARPT